MNVRELVDEVLALIRPDAIHRRVHLSSEVPGNLGPVLVNRVHLQQVLLNLLLNAMDAMPTGGTLALRTRPAPDGATLEVSDSGIGLSSEECDRIFTPYYTSKQHGTGLGLAIVQSVISDHHGKIGVRSQANQGTTFLIELPSKLDRLSAASPSLHSDAPADQRT